MKRYASIFMSIMIILTFVGCGKTEENPVVSLPAAGAEPAAVERAEKPAVPPAAAELILDELFGTYEIEFEVKGEDERDTMRFIFKDTDGQLIFEVVGDAWAGLCLPSGPYSYDPDTAAATYNEDEEDFSVTAEVNFTLEDGAVHLSSTVDWVMEGAATVYGKGVKID